MKEYTNQIRAFYNLVLNKYGDKKYAMIVTAMHFHLCFNDLERLGI